MLESKLWSFFLTCLTIFLSGGRWATRFYVKRGIYVYSLLNVAACTFDACDLSEISLHTDQNSSYVRHNSILKKIRHSYLQFTSLCYLFNWWVIIIWNCTWWPTSSCCWFSTYRTLAWRIDKVHWLKDTSLLRTLCICSSVPKDEMRGFVCLPFNL